MKKVLNPKIESYFTSIADYSQKEAKLCQIEADFTFERKLVKKNTILFNWVTLVDQRKTVHKYIYSQRLLLMKKALMSLKENLIKR